MLRTLTSAWRLPHPHTIGRDQLAAVVRATPAAALGALVNAAIVAVSMWNVVPHVELLAWLACTACIAGRQLFRRPGNRRSSNSPLSARTLRRSIIRSAIAALPWSILMLLFLGNLPHASELVLIAIGAGMAASGAVFLAPIYPAALTYVAVILLPAAFKCFLLTSSGYVPLGLLSLSYAGFLYAVIATKAHLLVERSQSSELLHQRDQLISAQNLRFESAINNMTQGLSFFDNDERLIVCNQHFVDMYRLDSARVRPGITLNEIVDMRYEVGSSPKMSRQEYLTRRSNAGRAGAVSDIVYELADGRTVEIRYRPMADGAWVATHEDITERRRLTQRLEDRTVLLQAVVDNFPGGIGYVDRDLRVILFNDKAKAILQVPEAFFANGPPRLEDLVRFHAERGEYGPGQVDELVVAKLALARSRQSFHYQRHRPDGRVVDLWGSPVDNGGFITTYLDITERHLSEAKIAHMATHDALTGLANRALLSQRLADAVAVAQTGERGIALLILDLNKFKLVNDTFGHPVGDLLLIAVAERLSRCVREEDGVTRLGGDEFAVVLHVRDPAEEARALAARILLALSPAYELGEHRVEIGASIGISVAHGVTADAERLIRHADTALYRAKAEGGNCCRFFEPEMERRVQWVA
jgi:diguanylate cyclase (GGDEF)-like protein